MVAEPFRSSSVQMQRSINTATSWGLPGVGPVSLGECNELALFFHGQIRADSARSPLGRHGTVRRRPILQPDLSIPSSTAAPTITPVRDDWAAAAITGRTCNDWRWRRHDGRLAIGTAETGMAAGNWNGDDNWRWRHHRHRHSRDFDNGAAAILGLGLGLGLGSMYNNDYYNDGYYVRRRRRRYYRDAASFQRPCPVVLQPLPVLSRLGQHVPALQRPAPAMLVAL